MRNREQLRVSKQRERLRRYIRTLRANYNRAWREVSAIFRIRKGCPFERALRHRRFEEASELLKLAEKCLAELNHCYALRIAAFRPGDQILVTTTVRGFEPDPRRYLILDVEWSKGDGYSYVVDQLTKAGAVHKRRYPHWVWPNTRVSIELSDLPLAEDTKWIAEGKKAAWKRHLEDALEKGDLSMFAPPTPPPPAAVATRSYPFWAR